MRPFGLSKALSKSFSDPVLEYLPDFFERQAVFDSEYEDLESLAQLASPEVVKERIERLGTSLGPDELSERVLYNDGTKVVVAGLRFRNLDLQFPFIALKLNFRADQESTIQLLKRLVLENFEEAAPRGFTLWEKPGQNLNQTATWSYLVAGPTSLAAESFKQQKALPERFEVKVEANSANFYDAYCDAYRAWSEQHRELAPFVQPESQADLDSSSGKGLLSSLYDGSGWAGIIAARSSPIFGTKALNLIEFFLNDRVRGQGLGRSFESHFLSRLSDQFDLAWGHIHSENLAALNTALGLGRKPIQQEYFFSLDI